MIISPPQGTGHLHPQHFGHLASESLIVSLNPLQTIQTDCQYDQALIINVQYTITLEVPQLLV